MRTINDFAMMDVMRYYDNPEPKTDGLRKKRQDMIDNKDNLYIATEKHDGDLGMFIHYSEGNNLIRSRSLSKVTGQYGDLTAKLPHLADEMNNWPDNTVILAEICWGEYGTNANTVGTILRCLPPKAVERQKDRKLVGKVFDALMLDGEDLTALPYIERLGIIDRDFNPNNQSCFCYFTSTSVFFNDFAQHADEIISAGGEGLVIQLKSNPYMPGTRTAWKTLKMKQALPHMDLKIVDTIEPNKYYNGDCPDTWRYILIEAEECAAGEKDEFLDLQDEEAVKTVNERHPEHSRWQQVTKPYFMGWKNGIVVDFNGVLVEVTSGLTDDDRAWLATEEAQKRIDEGLYAEIKAMSVNDLGSLRHPALVRIRTDLNERGE